MSARSRAGAGFTLLEILVAIGLTAFLVTATLQIFRQIVSTQERARLDRGRDRVAEILLDRIERELVGAILVVKPEDEDRLGFPWLFVGEDRLFGTDDSDGIRFVTHSPARAPGAAETALRLVTYAVDSPHGERLDLYRQEERLPAQLEKQIQVFEGQLALEDLVLFRLRFQHGGGEWRDDWDSTDLAMLDQLPAAVEVSVQLYEEDDAGELHPGDEHTRVIRLPVRPLLPEPELCATGPTVQECLEAFQTDLEALSVEDRERLQELGAELTSACWDEPQPTEKHAEFRALFEKRIEGECS